MLVNSSGKVRNGRGEANAIEPTQLSVKRVYRVQWKKLINQDELAKLYWQDGLTMKQIAERLGVGRTTVSDHLGIGPKSRGQQKEI